MTVHTFDFSMRAVRGALAEKLARQFHQSRQPKGKTAVLRKVVEVYLTHFEHNNTYCFEFVHSFRRALGRVRLDEPLSRIVDLLLIGPPKRVSHFPGLGVARLGALFTNPHYAELMLAMSLMGKTEYKEALGILERIPLAAMQKCVLFWLERATCRRKLEHLGQAEADLDRAGQIIREWRVDSARRCTCGDRCDVNQLHLTQLRSIAVVHRKMGVAAFRDDSGNFKAHFEKARRYFAEAIAVIEQGRPKDSALAADVHFSFGYFLFEQGFLGTYKNPIDPSPRDGSELIGEAFSQFMLSLENNPDSQGPPPRIALIDIFFDRIDSANRRLRDCFATWGDLSSVERSDPNIERTLSVVWTQIAAHGLASLQRQKRRQDIGRWPEKDIRKLLYDAFTKDLVPQGPLECHTFDLNVVKYLLGEHVSRFDDLIQFMNNAVTWECPDMKSQRQQARAHFPR